MKKVKERPIAYAAHKDAAIFTWYSHLLTARYESLIADTPMDACVTAFRSGTGKCNIHHAAESFNWIKAHGPCVALAFDIESFFDSLDHALLKTAWCRILDLELLPDDHYAVYRAVTRFAKVDRTALFDALNISRHNQRAHGRKKLCTPKEFRELIRQEGLIEVNGQTFGIPQGSPMSAILSNIYMLEFDTHVAAYVARLGGLYRRYCDDMLIVVDEEQAADAERFVQEAIALAKLTIQPDKTKRHHFVADGAALSVTEPLQYLGFLFDGVRTLVRTASIARYYGKMRAGVRLAVATKDKQNEIRRQKGEGVVSLKTTKLNKRYSYLGRRNFISYAHRASRIMEEASIKKQVKKHWGKLRSEIQKQDGE